MSPVRRNRGFRTLSVAAGVLFANVGHAQSSVTLYGALDQDILYTNKTLNPATMKNGGSQVSLVNGGWQPSRFGLTGSEDLGDGFKASFKLESGINVPTGGFNDSNGNFFGRQAWIALDSRYGEIKTGLQFSPFLIAVVALDPREFSFFGGSAAIYAHNVAATGIFTPNAITYSSPDFAGLRGRAMLSLGNVAGSFQAGRAYSGSLEYSLGFLLITAAIYDSNPGSATVTPIPSTVAFEGRVIGASYNFGSVILKASLTNYKVKSSLNNNVYGGGIEYRATPELTLNSAINYITDPNNRNNHSLLASIGAQYDLSKRTLVYAQAAIVNNHGAETTGFSVTGELSAPAGSTVGINMGLRHVF
ncbi:porin [Paraburkholderia sp. BR13439]|uniref:porin n=1 Tax=Paraburkholderia TaxID=1822464 RepID=UPI0034CD5785